MIWKVVIALEIRNKHCSLRGCSVCQEVAELNIRADLTEEKLFELRLKGDEGVNRVNTGARAFQTEEITRIGTATHVLCKSSEERGREVNVPVSPVLTLNGCWSPQVCLDDCTLDPG